MDSKFYILSCINSDGDHILKISDNRDESIGTYDKLVEEFGAVPGQGPIGGTLVLLQIPYDLLFFTKEEMEEKYPGDIEQYPEFEDYIPLDLSSTPVPSGGLVQADTVVLVPVAQCKSNSFQLGKRFFDANFPSDKVL